MHAITYARYGGPEVLELRELPTPEPGDGEVLLRVHAASINASDVRLIHADPFLIRLSNGLFAPKRQLLGSDVAGVVEKIGRGVSRLRVGDEVFGYTPTETRGGFAEYVAVPEAALIAMPDGSDFTHAASVVAAGMTALQAVRDRARLQPGDTVLIQGAGGGVGTLLVQLAKAYGAHVTAVCGPRSVDLVTELGADRVLDYTEQSFTEERVRYDAVFGVHGHHPLSAYRDVLKPGGTYVMIGGENRQIFGALFFGALRFRGSGKKIEVLTLDESRHAEDLAELRALLAAKKIRPVRDRVFPLADAADAMRYVEAGHVHGKVVLEIA